MNVTYKVAYAPGLEPVSILVIPPREADMASWYVTDTTQTALQSLAPLGQLWGDTEARTIAQAALDADQRSAIFGGFTVVIPTPPSPPDP